MLTFNIDKNVIDYDISLKSINVKSNSEKQANNLRIGIRSKYLNCTESGNRLIKPFSLDIVAFRGKDIGIDDKDKEKIDKLHNEEDGDFDFKINIVYEVSLLFDKEMPDSFKISKELDDYVYFLLQPNLNELVSYIGYKVGVVGLDLPNKKVFFNERNLEDANND